MLQLTDPKVKQALRHEALQGLKRLARGSFCAVYDKGDTVMKMTCDPIQYGYSTDYTAPQGEHFPTLIKNHGDIGETSDGDTIYLFEVEKLTPMSRNTPLYIKRIVRAMMSELGSAYMKHVNDDRRMSIDERRRRASIKAIDETLKNDTLPDSLKEALEDVSYFISNYEAVQDFHSKNVMLRGETIILNDVVAGMEVVSRLYSK